MIDVARIDHLASHGSGAFHRASVPGKLCFAALVVAAAVLARDPAPLAAGCVILVLIALFSGLPWRVIGVMSLTAALFALLYAVSLRRGVWVYALVLFKAVMPAFAVGMLILSTPYPRIFAFLSTYLPEIIASGLFMTYRSFFILLDMMDSFATAIRMRGGFKPGNLVRNGGNIAKGIGALLVRAVERSSRLYAVMAVRGYNGSLAEPSRGAFTDRDWLPLGAGVLVLASVLLW